MSITFQTLTGDATLDPAKLDHNFALLQAWVRSVSPGAFSSSSKFPLQACAQRHSVHSLCLSTGTSLATPIGPGGTFRRTVGFPYPVKLIGMRVNMVRSSSVQGGLVTVKLSWMERVNSSDITRVEQRVDESSATEISEPRSAWFTPDGTAKTIRAGAAIDWRLGWSSYPDLVMLTSQLFFAAQLQKG